MHMAYPQLLTITTARYMHMAYPLLLTITTARYMHMAYPLLLTITAARNVPARAGRATPLWLSTEGLLTTYDFPLATSLPGQAQPDEERRQPKQPEAEPRAEEELVRGRGRMSWLGVGEE
jgi:hypothetical protein